MQLLLWNGRFYTCCMTPFSNAVAPWIHVLARTFGILAILLPQFSIIVVQGIFDSRLIRTCRLVTLHSDTDET